jgi:hypothetical protein
MEPKRINITPSVETVANNMLWVVEGNIDYITKNFSKEARRLSKKISSISNEDSKIEIIREFVEKYHDILDADLCILGDIEQARKFLKENEGEKEEE